MLKGNLDLSRGCDFNPLSTPGSGIAFPKWAQFIFRNGKLRDTTIQADQKLGKYPDDRLVNIFQSGEMDGDLAVELVLVR
jgi:hypothetical protein